MTDSFQGLHEWQFIFNYVSIEECFAYYTCSWLDSCFSLTTLFLSENRSVAEVFLRPNLWLFFLIYIALFYLNTLWLIPKFFSPRKYFSYFSIIFCLLAGIAILKPFDRLAFERSRDEQSMRQRPHLSEFDTPPPRGEKPPDFEEPRREPT